MMHKLTIARLLAGLRALVLAGLPAIALAAAGCQTAPVEGGEANKEPTPKENTEPAYNTATNTEPEPESQPDPDVVKGQDGKEVIFVLGVDGMD